MVLMNVFGSLALFGCKLVWGTTRSPAAGRAIVRALSSKDETVRTLAGMFLVQAGERAEPILQDALKRRENLPTVLTILADIGDRKFEPEFREFCRDSDPQVAQAATEALRILEAQQRFAHSR